MNSFRHHLNSIRHDLNSICRELNSILHDSSSNQTDLNLSLPEILRKKSIKPGKHRGFVQIIGKIVKKFAAAYLRAAL
jgi:hypothetical protein